MMAALFCLHQFLIVQMTLWGLKMLKIQLMILTMKRKKLVFEDSISNFMNNRSIIFCILSILVYSILFFIFGYWRQASRVTFCHIDYGDYTINLLIRYNT